MPLKLTELFGSSGPPKVDQVVKRLDQVSTRTTTTPASQEIPTKPRQQVVENVPRQKKSMSELTGGSILPLTADQIKDNEERARNEEAERLKGEAARRALELINHGSQAELASGQEPPVSPTAAVDYAEQQLGPGTIDTLAKVLKHSSQRQKTTFDPHNPTGDQKTRGI